MRRAAREAKLVVHRIVNEPTAAAVAYGHKQARSALGSRSGTSAAARSTSPSSTSARDSSRSSRRAATTSSAARTSTISSHRTCSSSSSAAENLELEPEPQQIARLREAGGARQARALRPDRVPRRAPRVHARAEAHAPRRGDPRAVRQADAAAHRTTLAIATEVMRARSIAPGDVDDVLLVGGTTRIPAVQHAVAELFGRRPEQAHQPRRGRGARRRATRRRDRIVDRRRRCSTSFR